MENRAADPFRDLDVIDARAPRFNQAVIGSLSLVAVVTGQAWLLGLLGLQLFIGLTLGRRWCLPCLFYFVVVQPRWGEGPLEDSRPPRFANLIGLIFLGSATVSLYIGASTVGWVLGGIVAALALLAATTGLCAGCEFYKIVAHLRGVHKKGSSDRVDLDDFGGSINGGAVIQFTHPYCSDCREWEERLRGESTPLILVDVRNKPDLAKKYGVAIVPTVVAVNAEGQVTEQMTP